MIFFCVPARQAEHITRYVQHRAGLLRDEFRILHFEDLTTQTEFPRGIYVFSSLDQLTPAMSNLVLAVYEQLKDVEGFRFLNHPAQTLKRFELLNELHSLGMNEFRAVRANSNLKGLRFPVFVRSERLHEGAISPLLESEAEIRQSLGKALIQGHELTDLLVVEFCETANELGYYRKYGAFIVGDKIVPRSLNYGRNWMLKHAGTEFTTAMAQEELEYVTQNPHAQELKEIFQVAPVQYGRIDYSLKGSKVQTWEINLYPTIGRFVGPPSIPLTPEVAAIREQVREVFFSGLASAWGEVNVPGDNLPPVVVKIDPSVVAGSEEVVRRAFIRNAVRRVLRPAKPLLEPLSSPLLFLIGSLARFRRS